VSTAGFPRAPATAAKKSNCYGVCRFHGVAARIGRLGKLSTARIPDRENRLRRTKGCVRTVWNPPNPTTGMRYGGFEVVKLQPPATAFAVASRQAAGRHWSRRVDLPDCRPRRVVASRRRRATAERGLASNSRRDIVILPRADEFPTDLRSDGFRRFVGLVIAVVARWLQRLTAGEVLSFRRPV